MVGDYLFCIQCDVFILYELNLMSCSVIQLALRLVAIIKFDVQSSSTLVFTYKNGIILFLRLIATLTQNVVRDTSPLYQTTTNNEQQN